MLKELMKKVFNPASAEHQEEVTQMTEQLEQTTPAADNTAVSEMVAQLASQTEQLSTLQATLADLSTKYAAAEAALAASAEAQAMLVTQAAAAKLSARTASLTAIMGDVKGPATAAKLEALDDAAFAVVLDSYAASFAAEENTVMMTEIGVAAEATPVAAVEESAEMKIIKAKQAAARLQNT